MADKSVTSLQLNAGSRMESRLLSGFLRFMGVYPCTGTVHNGEGQGADADKTWQADILGRFIISEEVQALGTEFLEAAQSLSGIYTGCDLFQSGITLECFASGSPLILEAGQDFRRAYNCISREDAGNRYIRFAVLYCVDRANRAMILCNKALEMLLPELADRCIRLLGDFPDMYTAWLLIGAIYNLAQSTPSNFQIGRW